MRIVAGIIINCVLTTFYAGLYAVAWLATGWAGKLFLGVVCLLAWALSVGAITWCVIRRDELEATSERLWWPDK